MTHPENGKPLWNESRVETLLEEFFHQEMPPDLRSESPHLPPRHQSGSSRLTATPSRPRNASAERSRSSAGTMTVGFSALLLVMAAVLAWDRPAAPRENADSRSSGEQRKPEHARTHSSNPLAREGEGPVEMRPGIHHVREGDPDQGSAFPELDIEVFPLDREPGPGKNKKSAPPELPESRPPNSERPPMPEENRRLPENRSPQPPDPDEALEPVLPELETPPL